MKTALVLLAAVAAIAACAPKDFSKDGGTSEQFTRDEAQCKSQVRAQTRKERDIDDQRRSVFTGERERFGQQELYSDMANQGYRYTNERLVARCMEARGWQGKQNGPIPMLKLTW